MAPTSASNIAFELAGPRRTFDLAEWVRASGLAKIFAIVCINFIGRGVIAR
jgi:hypothetical protein